MVNRNRHFNYLQDPDEDYDDREYAGIIGLTDEDADAYRIANRAWGGDEEPSYKPYKADADDKVKRKVAKAKKTDSHTVTSKIKARAKKLKMQGRVVVRLKRVM